MRVIWVQQWTVLPVIVEDREMGDNNVQRGRVPVGGQQMDPSAPSRLSDSEARLPTRESILSFLIRKLSSTCAITHSPPSSILTF